MPKFVRLSPKSKGRKAAYELRTGKRYTNNRKPKRGKNGKHLTVSKAGRAYRAGYLDARKDIGIATQFKRKKKRVKQPKRGAYNRFGRVNENLVDDLYGPVVFVDRDFNNLAF